MKVYYDRSDTGSCEQITLGKALRLVFDSYEMGGWTHAADMLHKSSHSSTIVVDNGCVWIEDDVPALDFDTVIKDWWALKCKELPNGDLFHLLISCVKWSQDYNSIGGPPIEFSTSMNGRGLQTFSTTQDAFNHLQELIKERSSVEHTPASEPQDVEQHEPDATDKWIESHNY